MTPPVAIATVNWNTRLLVELLADSVRRHTPEPHTFYVADNGSRDGSVGFLQSRDDVVLVETGANIGHSAALEQLAATVEEDYLLCLDSDAHVYRDGWLTALFAHLDETTRAVGYQSGFGGDPELVSRSLHAFCLLIDLRPFRAQGRPVRFQPVVVDGRQVADVAAPVSLDLQEMGFVAKSLMDNAETKTVPVEARRYPDLPGREYHDGAGNYFIFHLFYGSQPYLRKRNVTTIHALLAAAYAHLDPGRHVSLALGRYYLRCLLTPELTRRVLFGPLRATRSDAPTAFA